MSMNPVPAGPASEAGRAWDGGFSLRAAESERVGGAVLQRCEGAIQRSAPRCSRSTDPQPSSVTCEEPRALTSGTVSSEGWAPLPKTMA